MTEPTAPNLDETSRTETTVRQFDADGRVIAETVITTVVRKGPPDALPTGMYL
jgi:hypothetical protein